MDPCNQTRGTRHQPASRCAASGYYILHSPTSGEGIKPLEKVTDKDHPRDFPVYLAYSIVVPPTEEFGDVQTELCIKPTGSFVIQGALPFSPLIVPYTDTGMQSSRRMFRLPIPERQAEVTDRTRRNIHPSFGVSSRPASSLPTPWSY